MLSSRLTNFNVQKYYQNEPKINGVYSRNNLSEIKDGAYILNLDDYQSIETHWVAFYVNTENAIAYIFEKTLVFFYYLK